MLNHIEPYYSYYHIGPFILWGVQFGPYHLVFKTLSFILGEILMVMFELSWQRLQDVENLICAPHFAPHLVGEATSRLPNLTFKPAAAGCWASCRTSANRVLQSDPSNISSCWKGLNRASGQRWPGLETETLRSTNGKCWLCPCVIVRVQKYIQEAWPVCSAKNLNLTEALQQNHSRLETQNILQHLSIAKLCKMQFNTSDTKVVEFCSKTT